MISESRQLFVVFLSTFRVFAPWQIRSPWLLKNKLRLLEVEEQTTRALSVIAKAVEGRGSKGKCEFLGFVICRHTRKLMKNQKLELTNQLLIWNPNMAYQNVIYRQEIEEHSQ